MGRTESLKMKMDRASSDSIDSDLKELVTAARNLARHAVALGSLGVGTTILKSPLLQLFEYLLILDRTNWKSNILTALLVPYIFFSLPSSLFSFFSGQVGKWIAFIAVILRLFFPRHFPDWLELPGSLILIIVVALSFFLTP